MNKGQRLDNITVCKPIRKLMNRDKRKVIDICRLLDRSYNQTYKYLRNPLLMTLGQLSTIAGYFGMGVLEFICMVHYNTPKPSKEQKAVLSSIIAKIEEENKEL